MEMSLASITGGDYQQPGFHIDYIMDEVNQYSKLTKEIALGESIVTSFGTAYKDALNSGNIEVAKSKMQDFLQEARDSGIALDGLEQELINIS
jgi:cobalamin biosynthesis Co2+ chelatase CbiK